MAKPLNEVYLLAFRRELTGEVDSVIGPKVGESLTVQSSEVTGEVTMPVEQFQAGSDTDWVKYVVSRHDSLTMVSVVGNVQCLFFGWQLDNLYRIMAPVI